MGVNLRKEVEQCQSDQAPRQVVLVVLFPYAPVKPKTAGPVLWSLQPGAAPWLMELGVMQCFNRVRSLVLDL
jgi:hypothetical protein